MRVNDMRVNDMGVNDMLSAMAGRAAAALWVFVVGVTLAAQVQAAGTPGSDDTKTSNEALAKAVQNPIANLISVPFQNNVNIDVGPNDRPQNVLNIQPVIPISITDDVNVITRTILPVISQPAFAPTQDRTNGLGDMQFSAFVSPANSEGVIWGVGAVTQFPTHTSDALGNDRWGFGPTAVVLKMSSGSPWVYGALVNNLWSVSSGKDGKYSNFLLQPFLNYNFEGGLYLSSAPIITARWKQDDGDRWTVPIGGGVGKIVRIGKLPLNLQTQAFYNVVTPDQGPDWTVRVQVQFMFPK